MKKLLPNISLRIKKRLVIATIGFWVPVLIFIELAKDILGKEPILIDTPITQAIRDASSEYLSNIMRILTHGGDVLFILIATVLIAGYLRYKNRRRDMLAVIFSVGGAGLINLILKLFFQRNRPSIAEAFITESGFSFPSGHAMGSAALGIVIFMLLYRTKWRWLAVVLSSVYIITIGFTRIYLGVHYPSDVVAGWCVSAVWVLVVFVALEHPTLLKRILGRLHFNK